MRNTGAGRSKSFAQIAEAIAIFRFQERYERFVGQKPYLKAAYEAEKRLRGVGQMAASSELVRREREILEHSLKAGSDRVYRNYFAADLASLDGLTCLDLVKQGLMVQGRRLSDNVELHYFHVTKAGAEAVGLHLPRE